MSKNKPLPAGFKNYEGYEELYKGFVLQSLLRSYINSESSLSIIEWLGESMENRYVLVNDLQSNKGRQRKTCKFLTHLGALHDGVWSIKKDYYSYSYTEVNMSWVYRTKDECGEYGMFPVKSAHKDDESIFHQSYVSVDKLPYKNLIHLFHNQDKYSIVSNLEVHDGRNSSSMRHSVLALSNFDDPKAVYRASIREHIKNNGEASLDFLLGREVFTKELNQDGYSTSLVRTEIKFYDESSELLSQAKKEAEFFKGRYEAQLELTKILGTDQINLDILEEAIYKRLMDGAPLFMADNNLLGIVANHALQSGVAA